MTRVDSSPRRSTSERIARVITEVFAPVVLTVGLLLVVGASSTDNPLVGLGWGLLAALFVGVIPYAFLLLGVRRGRWTDRHLPVRKQRLIPLLYALASTTLGVATLVGATAPRQLVALVFSGLAGLAVSLCVTLVWKMSIHAAVAGGAAAILALNFGWATFALSLPALAAIVWSRKILRAHNNGQLAAGAAVGALVASATYISFT